MADDTRPGTTDRAGAEFGAAAGARNPKGAADPECSAAWSGERGRAHEAVTGAPTHFAYRAHTPAPVADGVPLVGFGDEPALLVARPAGRRPMPERRGPDRVLPIVAPS